MAGKRYRSKRRSCSLCKPGKRGITPRWKDPELERLLRFEHVKSGARDWYES
jgi:hypothetical protein